MATARAAKTAREVFGATPRDPFDRPSRALSPRGCATLRPSSARRNRARFEPLKPAIAPSMATRSRAPPRAARSPPIRRPRAAAVEVTPRSSRPALPSAARAGHHLDHPHPGLGPERTEEGCSRRCVARRQHPEGCGPAAEIPIARQPLAVTLGAAADRGPVARRERFVLLGVPCRPQGKRYCGSRSATEP